MNCYQKKIPMLEKTKSFLKSIEEELSLYYDCLRYRFKAAKYFLINYIQGSHRLDSGVKRGHSSDIYHKIERSLFLAIDEFASKDKEDALSFIDWENNDGHVAAKETIKDVLHFLHIEEKELKLKEEKLLGELYKCKYDNDLKNKPMCIFGEEKCEDCPRPREEEAKKLHDEYWNLENYLHDKKTELLRKIVDIRDYLWS